MRNTLMLKKKVLHLISWAAVIVHTGRGGSSIAPIVTSGADKAGGGGDKGSR